MAAIGLFFIWLQVGVLKTNSKLAARNTEIAARAAESAAKIARETSARQLYLSLYDTAARYPELLEPDLTTLKKNRLNYARYAQYVGHTLFAYDEIFSVIDDPEWRATFEIDVANHLEHFCTEWNVTNVAQYYVKIRERLYKIMMEQAPDKCPLRAQWAKLSAPDYLPGQ